MSENIAVVVHEPEESILDINLTEDQAAVLSMVLPILEKQGLTLKAAHEDIEMLKEALEVNVVLSTAQGKAVKAAVNLRVRQLCKDESEYKEKSKKLFKGIWGALKEVFVVDTYREIPRNKYGSAIAYIGTWKPPA